MALYKRILMEIIRRPFRAVILMIMIFVLSIAAMIGFFLLDIVKTAYEEFIKLDGYSVAIDSTTQESIPDEIKDRILDLDHVIGYNNNSNIHGYFKPVNFINIPYDGNEMKQSEEAIDIILCANIDTRFYQAFRNGELVLIKGVFPDFNHKGVLMDEMLAKANGFEIGEYITLYNEAYDKAMEFCVIGIYKTIAAPDMEVYSDFGTHYKVSVNSYIFCDYNSFFDISDRDSAVTSIIFYIDEYDNIVPLYNRIGEILPEGRFTVINCLENNLGFYGRFIITLKDTTSSLLKFTYMTSLFILFLMTILWMRSHYYEAGIYIALGLERYKIVLYFMLEILIIVISTLFGSLLIGQHVIFSNKHQLLKLALGFTNSEILYKTIESSMIEKPLSIQAMIYVSGSYLAMAAAATLLSCYVIFNYKTRKLFNEQ